MAEQNLNFQDLEQFIIPNNNKVLEKKSNINITPPTDKTSNFNQLENFIVNEEEKIKDSNFEDLNKFIINKEDTSKIETKNIISEEPSWFRKFLYGFDKQDQFFGNVWRIGKSKVIDLQDDNRNFKEVIQDNAGIENQKLLNRFQKFKGGKYDDDIYTKAGEMASLLLDPFYLMAYLTPWGRAATASYKGLAMIGGSTVGLDKLISDYATTGEFKPKDAAIAATGAAVLSPAAVKAFRVVSKYFPGADKKKIAQIIGIAEGKKAKSLGISNSQYKKLQEVVNDKEFLTLNKLIEKSGVNYSKGFQIITLPHQTKLKSLNKTINEIQKLNKQKFTKTNQNKITKLEDKKDSLIESFKKDKKELVKKQEVLFNKNLDLIKKRDVRILEKLKENQSLDETVIKYVLSATTRPLFGAGVGYAFGTLWGAEDADLDKWIYGGAVFGGLQKGIKASKILSVGDKNVATNILNNEAVKLSLQKLREITSTTAATKLEAFGGKTEQLGKMLLQSLDSPYAKNSVAKVQDDIQRQWTIRAVKLFNGYNSNQGTNALNSLRGSKIKLSVREKVLKRNIQKYMDDFQILINDSGIFLKDNLKNYFPRVYDFGKINRNPKEFRETLIQIFKNKKNKNPTAAADNFNTKINDVGNMNVVRTSIDDLINDKKFSNNFIITPLSNHINKQRKLTGSFNQVEKLLSDKGFLINNPSQVLSSLVNRSAGSIAFAQRFGPSGQFLAPFYKAIKTKYKNTGKTNWRELAKKETQVINNTIEAYFDRYGMQGKDQLKALSGMFATVSNLNMLDRVTIASLGDIVQPFTNSTNWTAWLRALARTSVTAKGETGLAKNLGQAQTNEIKSALLKPLAIKGDEITAHTSWLGSGGPLSKINNAFFTISGLQWLTGFARRFAYNAGASDAFITARKFTNYVSRGGKVTSNKGSNFVKDLDRYGISITDALKIGKFSSLDAAAKTRIGKINLNDAGILAANRDAIIPQASNRLIFAQSNTPWVRLMGQFLSWAMAKSAQTNKILSRIENGDARTMVKLFAAIPVYGGINELRELAKYGEVVTSIDSQTNEWWSEAFRLSGLPGVGPEFLANLFVGPGSRQPFFTSFPAGSIAYEADKIAKDYFKGNTELASERFFQRIFPLPNWRNFILERAKDLGVDFDDGGRKLPPNKLERRQFNKGDEVVNKKDLAAATIATTMAVNGVNADVPSFSEGVQQKYPSNELGVIKEEAEKIDALEEQMEKAADKKILPRKKPRITNEIKYRNISELSPEKKTWLLDTAQKVYTTNIDNVLPNDVIIAMASGETGWGTSGFLNKGSNNLFNFQSFNDEEKSIAASGSNAKIKVFDKPEDSITELLTWVKTKKAYAPVREEIALYNEGKGSKEKIIKSIADTGFAEDGKWSSKITSILNSRIDGKHKDELNKLYNSLFVDN